jgi:tetratricopeptide (TPR) repeat protein
MKKFADELFENREYEKAKDEYLLLLTNNSKDFDIYIKLSECYYRLDDLQKAEEFLKLAEKLNPQNPKGFIIQANVLMKQNQKLDLAYQLAEKAYIMRPEDPEILQSFGNANLFICKYPEGITLLEEALPNSKDKESILFNLFIAYGKEKRYRESLKSSWALYRIHPTYNRFIRCLGACLSLPFIRYPLIPIIFICFVGFLFGNYRWLLFFPFILFSLLILIGVEKIRKKEITIQFVLLFIIYILFDIFCAYNLIVS